METTTNIKALLIICMLFASGYGHGQNSVSFEYRIHSTDLPDIFSPVLQIFVILFVSQIFMTAPNIKQLKMGKTCIFFLIQSHLSSIPEMEAVF